MKIIILGFGVMGKQIASLMVLLGYEVIIWNHRRKDDDVKQLERNIRLLKKRYKVARNDECYEFICDIELLPHGLYIECVKENLALKKDIFQKLSDRSECYFSNTSSYCLSEIGGRVNGLHFFNPITMNVLEYHLLDDLDGLAQTLLSDISNFGFDIVPVNDNRGFIGNYLLFNQISLIFKLIEKHGYKYQYVDKMHAYLYNGKNIFHIIDLVGVDVSYNIIKNLNEEDGSIYLPNTLKKALAQNVLGKKNNTSIVDIL